MPEDVEQLDIKVFCNECLCKTCANKDCRKKKDCGFLNIVSTTICEKYQLEI